MLILLFNIRTHFTLVWAEPLSALGTKEPALSSRRPASVFCFVFILLLLQGGNVLRSQVSCIIKHVADMQDEAHRVSKVFVELKECK